MRSAPNLLGHGPNGVGTHKVVLFDLNVGQVKSFAASPHAPAFTGKTADAPLREVVGIGTDAKTGKLGIGGKTFGPTGQLDTAERIAPPDLQKQKHLFELDDCGQGVDVGLIIDGTRTRAMVARKNGIYGTVIDLG